MNKAIFFILLGILVLAQAKDVALQEERSEAVSVSEIEGQGKEEVEGFQHSRQLLTMQTTHNFGFLYDYCMNKCTLKRPRSSCNQCCSYHTYLIFFCFYWGLMITLNLNIVLIHTYQSNSEDVPSQSEHLSH